jgi:2-isopropylmalate synthase
VVQKYADETKKEVKDDDIWHLFKDEYLPSEEAHEGAVDPSLASWGRLKLMGVSVSSGDEGSDTVLKAKISDRGVGGKGEPIVREISGVGNGPIAAFLSALAGIGIDASVLDYQEHTMSNTSDAAAASYVEAEVGEADNTKVIWGVGIDSSISNSAFKAIISAINRFER